MEDFNGVVSQIGSRLRSIRQRHGMTLATLSRQVGVSVSTLSRLESGHRRPTLELLLPLARVHQLSLDELIGAPATGDPRAHPRPAEWNGSVFLPLTSRSDGLLAYKQIIPANWPRHGPDPRVHEGSQRLQVLTGRLRLVLGRRDVVLKAGEAAEFDTRVPHWIANPDDVPAELIGLFTPRGHGTRRRAGTAALLR